MSFLSMMRRRRRPAASVAENEPDAPEPKTPTQPEEQAAARPAAVKIAPAHRHPAAPQAPAAALSPVQIVAMCDAVGESGAALALIERKATAAEVEARLDDIREIRDIDRRARSAVDLNPGLLNAVLSGGLSLTAARRVYNEAMVINQSPEIMSVRPVNGSADHGWGNVMAKHKSKTT